MNQFNQSPPQPLIVPASQEHIRLDIFLSQNAPYSRSFFKQLIESGAVSVNGRACTRPGVSIKSGTRIEVNFPRHVDTEQVTEVKTLPTVEVIFEHEQFLILNKPAGLLVHMPSLLSTDITLVDWLMAHYKEIGQIGTPGRAGIIHRLDRDTSGIIVIPRTPQAHTAFGTLFRERLIKKTYLAVVSGTPPSSGAITYPLARDLQDKTRIKAIFPSQELFYRSRTKVRASHTDFMCQKQFNSYSLVEAKPITGRTHQIRVHLAALGHPVLGDALYGTSSPLIQRQALHASEIQFQLDGHEHHFYAPLPDDLQNLIK